MHEHIIRKASVPAMSQARPAPEYSILFLTLNSLCVYEHLSDCQLGNRLLAAIDTAHSFRYRLVDHQSIQVNIITVHL